MDDSARRGLGLGPSLLYPAKAAYTRARSCLWAVARRDPEAGLRVLMYHRVTDDRDELGLAPHDFARQMEMLASRGFEIVDVVAAVERLQRGEDCSRVVALTFDDGYGDIAANALPVLERLGATATVFVATGVTDGRATFSWYDRQPPLLSWDDVRSLDGGVFRFEAHTVTHPNLLDLDDDEAQVEIADSKHELEAQLGRAVRAFCYPAGLFGERERQLVEAAGYDVAVSCEPGVNTRASDPLALRRTQIDRRDSLLDFRAKVAGAHDSPPPLRAAWRRMRYGAAG